MLLLSACGVSLRVPSGAEIACGDNRDCPSGYVCAEVFETCLADDQRPPAVQSAHIDYGTASTESRVTVTGTVVDIEVVADEPLAGIARLVISCPAGRVVELENEVDEDNPTVVDFSIDWTCSAGDRYSCALGAVLADRLDNSAGQLTLEGVSVDIDCTL